MYSVLKSYGLNGLNGFAVAVEADVSGGLPAFSLVGLPDSAVRESGDRVRSAMKNLGYKWPDRHITVNLAPADIRKSGPVYDLPLLLAVLASSGQMEEPPADAAFLGELALDGSLRPVSGVLPMALAAAAVLALNLVSVGMDRLLGFPARESLFALIPWWVWPVTFLAALAVGFASGILLLAFGQRGFWAMWGIWMVAFIVPANTPGLDFAALPAPLMIAGAALAAAVLLGWLVWSVWYALHCPVKL